VGTSPHQSSSEGRRDLVAARKTQPLSWSCARAVDWESLSGPGAALHLRDCARGLRGRGAMLGPNELLIGISSPPRVRIGARAITSPPSSPVNNHWSNSPITPLCIAPIVLRCWALGPEHTVLRCWSAAVYGRCRLDRRCVRKMDSWPLVGQWMVGIRRSRNPSFFESWLWIIGRANWVRSRSYKMAVVDLWSCVQYRVTVRGGSDLIRAVRFWSGGRYRTIPLQPLPVA
jgi:hypothetical protein